MNFMSEWNEPWNLEWIGMKWLVHLKSKHKVFALHINARIQFILTVFNGNKQIEKQLFGCWTKKKCENFSLLAPQTLFRCMLGHIQRFNEFSHLCINLKLNNYMVIFVLMGFLLEIFITQSISRMREKYLIKLSISSQHFWFREHSNNQILKSWFLQFFCQLFKFILFFAFPFPNWACPTFEDLCTCRITYPHACLCPCMVVSISRKLVETFTHMCDSLQKTVHDYCDCPPSRNTFENVC